MLDYLMLAEMLANVNLSHCWWEQNLLPSFHKILEHYFSKAFTL